MNASQFKRLQERRRIAEAHAAKIIRDQERRSRRKAKDPAPEPAPKPSDSAQEA